MFIHASICINEGTFNVIDFEFDVLASKNATAQTVQELALFLSGRRLTDVSQFEFLKQGNFLNFSDFKCLCYLRI